MNDWGTCLLLCPFLHLSSCQSHKTCNIHSIWAQSSYLICSRITRLGQGVSLTHLVFPVQPTTSVCTDADDALIRFDPSTITAETCLAMNRAYQEVLLDTLRQVEISLAENRDKQVRERVLGHGNN